MININLPTSKSISNRALLIQALCTEPCTLVQLSEANDTIVLQEILSHPQDQNNVHAQDAGTAFRFLLAYFAIQKGCDVILRGSKRMHERPIADLVDALTHLGAQISYEEKHGYPPLRIRGCTLPGGNVNISGAVSSQFISALCLIAPTLEQGLQIHIENEIVSNPYIIMTTSMMRDFGVETHYKNHTIHIAPQRYRGRHFQVEADWSAASFFYAACLVHPNLKLNITGLQQESLQGDAAIATLCRDFGIETIYTTQGVRISYNSALVQIPEYLDFTDHPDLAVPLMVVMAIQFPHITIRGVHHLAYKESNRLIALQTELKKAGCHMHILQDEVRFDPPTLHQETLSFQSYQDHRIVMALHVFELLGNSLQWDDTQCVQKSFPHFVREWRKLSI